MKKMKLIIRADDLGLSEGVNLGIHKAIQDGVVTSVALMTNMDAAQHGYDLVKNFDIALGVHVNISVGYPLCDASLIPTLVQDNGEFCTSKEIHGRKVDLIDVKECELEIEAQLHRFIDIVGKKPDYFECHAVFADHFFTALKNVAKKYDLFFENPIIDKEWEKEYGIVGEFINLDENGLYDPQAQMQNYLRLLKNNSCVVAVFHPGYIDQYLIDHSSYTLIRPMECEFLCSDWLREWIKKNDIQLVDFRNYKE